MPKQNESPKSAALNQLDISAAFDELMNAIGLSSQDTGGKITFMMRYEGSPMAGQAPAGYATKVLHAGLSFGDGGRAGRILDRHRNARVDHQPEFPVRRRGPAPDLWPSEPLRRHGAELDDG